MALQTVRSNRTLLRKFLLSFRSSLLKMVMPSTEKYSGVSGTTTSSIASRTDFSRRGIPGERSNMAKSKPSEESSSTSSSKTRGSSLSLGVGEEPTGGVALGIAVNKDDTV